MVGPAGLKPGLAAGACLGAVVATAALRAGERRHAAERAAAGAEQARLVHELEDAHVRLEAVLRHVDAAITVRDADGRTVFVNAAAAELLGAPEDELVARGVEERLAELELRDEAGALMAPAALPAHRLLRGEPVPETTVLRLGPGGRRWLENKVTVLGADGARLAVGITEDVTAVRRTQATQRLVTEALEALSDPTRLRAGVDRVVELLVPTHAAGARIRLDGGVGASAGHLDADPPLEVAVRTGDEAYGSLELAGAGCFGPPDPALAADLAQHLAVAALHARVSASRAAIADTLQRSLLPRALPEIPGYALASRFRPAGELNETGGDFYDAIDVADGRWAILVGDVAGKGAEAAAVTGRARATLATALSLDPSPETALEQLNRTLCEEGGFSLCTLALVLLDPRRHDVEVWLAGHPHPLLRTASGAAEVGIPGPLLGATDAVAWQGARMELPPGAPLLLYTDGVTDALGPAGRWGTKRLRDATARAPQEPEALLGRIEAELDEHADRFPDDIAMVAVARV